MNSRILPANTPVTRKESIIYGLFGGGSFVYGYIMFQSVIMYYFTDVLGITAAAAGVLLLVARAWDGINDPLMGIIIDKTNTRWGKNRPYIFAGGILTSIFLVLLFTKPSFLSDGGRLGWAYFTYIGYGMAYTMYTISIGSLGSRLTTDRLGITKLNSAFYIGSSAMSIFATLIFMSFIGKFAGAEGDMGRGYQLTACVAGAITLVFSLVSAFSIKERNLQGESPKKIGFLAALKAMLTNTHYIGFMISQAIVLLGYYLSVGTIMYYCIYNLGSAESYTPLLFCDYATPIIAALTLPYIVKKLGQRSIVVLATTVTCVAYLLRYLTGDSSVFIMTMLAGIGGIAMGYYNVLFTPIAMDCSIYTEHKTGLQLQGSFIAANGIIGKIVGGISGALLGFILAGIGYVEGAAEQSATTLNGLKLCATLSFSVAAAASLIVFLLTYRLKEKDIEKMNIENLERRGSEN
ncbi:MAG: MFS transporter [Oscillospiraceae bacterium]|nr:MFS transporter [Oscillospiraceae bacterium]